MRRNKPRSLLSWVEDTLGGWGPSSDPGPRAPGSEDGPQPPGRTRRGFSLIELLAVMAGLSVALGLCVGLIHVLLRLDRASHAHLTDTMTVSRLARQFRQDVRGAARGEVGDLDRDGSPSLSLTLPDDRTIRYDARPGALVRVEHSRKGDRREAFRFARERRIQLECLDDKNGDRWAGLVLAGEPEATAKEGPATATGPSRAVRIDAMLGKDRRLAHAHLGENAR